MEKPHSVIMYANCIIINAVDKIPKEYKSSLLAHIINKANIEIWLIRIRATLDDRLYIKIINHSFIKFLSNE